MKLQVTYRTIMNLGDRGMSVEIPIPVTEEDTIGGLIKVCREHYCTQAGNSDMMPFDTIIIQGIK